MSHEDQNPGRADPAPEGAQAIRPTSGFLRRVEAECGANISACYGCKKCTNGCPLLFAMDLYPYQVVRYAQLGQTERLRSCHTIWLCASCQTCYTRCPNDVDLPRLMDYLKEAVCDAGDDAAEERTKLFHQLFLREIKARGRVFEGSLLTRFMLSTGGAFGPEAKRNAALGWQMLRRGRIKLLPVGTKDRAWLKALFQDAPKEKGGAK